MKRLFGWPTRACWRLPKPSRVTSRGLAKNKGKDHRLIPAAEVEVNPELALEVSLKLTLEVGPALALEVSLEIMLEPTVKVPLMVTYGTCILSPPDEPLPRRRVTFTDPQR